MTDFQQYFDESHQLIRDSVRRFVEREVLPHIDEWEEAEEFPRELYLKAGAAGILGIGYPEAYGGSCEGDLFAKVAASEELMRCGSGGLVAGLGSLDIGLPPVVKWARPEVRERVVPAVLRGEKIMALAVTEPSGGSDVANLKTRAVRDGDHYRVSGSKTFITSGVRADYYTVAVRTGGEGFAGISLLLVEKGTAGFSVGRKLKKMGWWASDTAELFFDDCRVPASQLIGGVEGVGFKTAMKVLDKGRLHIAAVCVGVAERMLEDALRYALERKQFGQPIAEFQLIQAMLADSKAEAYAARCMVIDAARQRDEGRDVGTEASCAKLFASEMCGRVADRAVQIFGGAGYIGDYGIERFYRDVRLFRIYEGTTQIQQLLIARNMIRAAQG